MIAFQNFSLMHILTRVGKVSENPFEMLPSAPFRTLKQTLQTKIFLFKKQKYIIATGS